MKDLGESFPPFPVLTPRGWFGTTTLLVIIVVIIMIIIIMIMIIRLFWDDHLPFFNENHIQDNLGIDDGYKVLRLSHIQ